jgi:hypothetical protein
VEEEIGGRRKEVLEGRREAVPAGGRSWVAWLAEDREER